MSSKRLPFILIGLLLLALLIPACAGQTPAPATTPASTPTSKPPASTPAATPTPAGKPATTPPAAAPGQSAADFYKGKTVTIIVPSSPGGSQDGVTRIFAPKIAAKIGATVVVENLSTAGGAVAYTKMSRSTKPDGLTICLGNTTAMWPPEALGLESVDWEAAKFTYLGSVQEIRFMFVVKKGGTYTSVDALKKAKGLKFGGSGAGGWTTIGSSMAAEIMGFDARIVLYTGSAPIELALLQGELQGTATAIDSGYQKVQSGTIEPLFMIDSKRASLFPNLPAISELKKLSDYETRLLDMYFANDKIWIAPPDLPEDRTKYLGDVLYELAMDKSLEKTMMDTYGMWNANKREEVNSRLAKFLKDKDDYKKIYGALREKYKS